MWRPGFPHEDAVPARLTGAHRALCVYSHVHRGTPSRPGLVLGLDRGGACRGVAFRVASTDWEETVAYLRAREQATAVYLERLRPVTLIMSDNGSGPSVSALTYLVDRDHIQYAGRLSEDRQHSLVLDGHGQAGPNIDYIVNTVAHLRELGIHDVQLMRLAERLTAGTRDA
ncbi:MAG: gamma-glutamylcyclotransferase, partial [Pseudomonadota bacterium]